MSEHQKPKESRDSGKKRACVHVTTGKASFRGKVVVLMSEVGKLDFPAKHLNASTNKEFSKVFHVSDVLPHDTGTRRQRLVTVLYAGSSVPMIQWGVFLSVGVFLTFFFLTKWTHAAGGTRCILSIMAVGWVLSENSYIRDITCILAWRLEACKI